MINMKKSFIKTFTFLVFISILLAFQNSSLDKGLSLSNNALYENNLSPAVVNNIVAANKSTTPVIVIDAGHGGYDTGAIGFNKTKEKDITLPVALKVGTILKKNGMKVIYTRSSDKVSFPRNEKQNLNARTQISNSNNANLFVSIHANSSIFKFVNGAETYYGKSNTSKKIAGFIENQIVKNNKLYNRGIKSEDYYVLKNTHAPSVLVELGFITNAKDESIISNSNNQQKLANLIANGILQYFKN